MLRNTSDWRRCWFAPKPPIAPGDTLITAHGLLLHALLPYGRDATSSAFFSAPGTDRLYSGVTNNTASARAMRALNAADAGGGSASSSWLNSGRLPISTIAR